MKISNYQQLTIVAAMLLFLTPLGVVLLVSAGSSTQDPGSSRPTAPPDRTDFAAAPGIPAATARPAELPSRNSESDSRNVTRVRPASPPADEDRSRIAMSRTPGLGTDTVPSLADSSVSPQDTAPPAVPPLLMPPATTREPDVLASALPMADSPNLPPESTDSVIPGVSPLGTPDIPEPDQQPPQPVIPDESYYDATRHPALAGKQRTPQELPAPQAGAERSTQAPVANPAGGSRGDATELAGKAGREPTSDSRERKSRQRKRQPPEQAAPAGRDRTDRSRPEAAANPRASDTVPPPVMPDNLEEVIVQTPLESGRVRKIEDVIAITSAVGWPIALVRSDIPDDEWWVQQMVTIQGTTFAARVNFGNEHSLPGSAYRMVFVFLDSPDEVRRFRIAKRFTELPKGIRRSREFRYVRN